MPVDGSKLRLDFLYVSCKKILCINHTFVRHLLQFETAISGGLGDQHSCTPVEWRESLQHSWQH